jgi:hypothetical protein
MYKFGSQSQVRLVEIIGFSGSGSGEIEIIAR